MWFPANLRRPPGGVAASQRGMVTAETAAVLPVLVFVAVLLAGLVTWGTAQAQVNETARHAARMLARGESEDEARRWLKTEADSAQLDTHQQGDHLTVTVSKPVGTPVLPGFTVDVRGTATVVAE